MGSDLIKIEIIHRRNPFNLFRLDRGQTSGNPIKRVWGVVKSHSLRDILYLLQNCYKLQLYFQIYTLNNQIHNYKCPNFILKIQERSILKYIIQ